MRCGRSRRTPSRTSPASACSATRTRSRSAAACGSCSTRRALPLLPGALEAAAAGVRTGGDRRNRDFAAAHVETGGVAEDLVALAYDPQTSGGLLIALPGRQGRGARGRVRRARPLPRPDRPRRGGRGRRARGGWSPRSPACASRALAGAVRAARGGVGALALPDRPHRRGRPADGLRARLPVLAGLPGGRVLPGGRPPLGDRVRQPRRSRSSRSRSASSTWVAAPRTPRAAALGDVARGARLPRDDRAGAARPADDQARPAPADGAHPLPARARRARRRGRARGRGLGQRARRVARRPCRSGCGWLGLVARRRVRRRSSSPARSSTAAGPHPGDSADIDRFWNSARRRLDARPRDRGLRPLVPGAARLARAQPRRARPCWSAAPRSCSRCCSSQMAVGELQYRNAAALVARARSTSASRRQSGRWTVGARDGACGARRSLD